MLNNQIHIYSVDTSAFYNKDESKINDHLNQVYYYKKELKKKRKKFKKQYSNKKWLKDINSKLKICNKEIKLNKKKLCHLFNKNISIRSLNKKYINKHNIVSVFESNLSRTMGIKINELTDNIIIVQIYFFQILKDLIDNGFYYNGEKYVFFTASAGQIRTKKTVFIKERILNQYWNTLTCGLTIKNINKKGGMNINKFLAYLALSNSATDLWEDFDINKTIVVDDMETLVNGTVDFIDDITYKTTRKNMDVPITHTDGCGMMLLKVSKKNTMVRLPWVKGLLISFPFDKFIREKCNGKCIVKDIYGQDHNILKENIQIIFTKSQFKMWKFYDSWKQYQNNFVKYNCYANKCNEEEDDFDNVRISYQMLQTLTQITDCEIKNIAKQSINDIKKIGSDRKTMLKILGVTKSNQNKNYLQRALEIYPELLNDCYSRSILKQVKKSLVKRARGGKLNINGKYTFLSPDLYAFCEYLFLGNKNPKGLLENGQVCCKLFENAQKLDCLRSPHLFFEHSIRKNIITNENKRWFTTNAIYTSCHDLISKILQFDNDGDKSLVCSEETLVKVAERNSKGIVPLYYNMKKAEPEIINNKNIYKGLIAAYSGGNIGLISNSISKIWNSNFINLDAIKILCMENNFVIDYAKTLYKPQRPLWVKDLISEYTKKKVPHFFIYSKNKTYVENNNNSTVNKLEKIIPDPILRFNAKNLGKFNYKNLMCNKKYELLEDDQKIIDKYNELDLKKHFMINKIDEKSENINYLYWDIRQQILKLDDDIFYVTDVLIEYLYNYKKSNFKTTLWECFGDVIVKNLKKNISENYILCEKCGKRIIKENNKTKYCDECAKEIKSEQDRIADKKYKEKKKSEKIENTCKPLGEYV